MARKKKESVKTGEEKGSNVINPSSMIKAALDKNKEDHFNYEKSANDYKIPSSSLTLNYVMNGGLEAGAHRFIGATSGGKTSEALDFMNNFLKEENRFGLYVKSEGRLSNEHRRRSGVKFVDDPDDWVSGTCFILESNVYEMVFSTIGDLIRNNTNGAKYFFIIDSMDMMGKRDDLKKPYEDSAQVAGGALLTSVFLKKTSVALAKRGHVIIFISQIRDTIKANAYVKINPKQGSSSGGHAIEHAGDWVLDFQNVYSGDLILEDENNKNSDPIGHYCSVNILKSNNEKRGCGVKYPIKYNRPPAKSVWVEKEVVDICLLWGLIKRAGSWFSIDEDLLKELREIKEDFPEKLQGMPNVYAIFEENEEIISFLCKKIQELNEMGR